MNRHSWEVLGQYPLTKRVTFNELDGFKTSPMGRKINATNPAEE
jgi:hypothetical protein